MQILLKSGEVVRAQRVRMNGLGMVNATKLDGRDSVLAPNRVRTIIDEQGRDRTKEVLVNEQEVHVGGPGPPPEKEKAPAKERGPYLSAHVGPVLPLGSFRDIAETGFGLDASLHWRTSKRDVLGARIEFTEFGGDRDLEGFLSTGTAGAIDQLRFRLWGVSAISRWFILTGHRVDPFLHTSLGINGFTTSLAGPGGNGSHTSVTLPSYELGVGFNVRLAGRTNAELAAAYTRADAHDNTVTAAGAAFGTSGTLQYLQVKVGVVRRFGGGG